MWACRSQPQQWLWGIGWGLGLGLLGGIGSPLPGLSQSAIPDTRPDASLGTLVNTQATTDLIHGGTRQGGNLFHSFSQFNVRPEGVAIFLTPVGVTNILTRVTGNQPSQILGGLQTRSVTGGATSANLFLINPQGILFGGNARLDLGGAFLGSTANALQLGPLGLFSATAPDQSRLLSVSPTALLFNSPNSINPGGTGLPGEIRITGTNRSGPNLEVMPGRSLLLVGGKIWLEQGQLSAPSGRVELAALAGAAAVPVQGEGWQLGLGHLTGNFEGLTDVTLTNNSLVNVVGLGGGNIVIQAKTLTVRENTQFITGTFGLGDAGNIEIRSQFLSMASGASIVSFTFDSGNAGAISIAANQIEFANASVVASVAPGATGRGGNIQIETQRLLLRNGSAIDASTFGPGAAGQVLIQSLQPLGQVSIIGGSVITSTGQFNGGQGGTIRLQTGQILVESGGQISTSTFGGGGVNAGTVTLQAQELRLNSGVIAARSANGQGGNLDLQISQLLTLERASRISATAGTATSGGGDGGNIRFQEGFIVAFPGELGGNTITANAFAGTGGNIQLTTQGLLGFQANTGNQITASSRLGLQGTVIINRPEADPSQGLEALPTTVADATGLIAPTCASASAGGNRFTVTGRGGLPASPQEALTTDALVVGLVPLAPLQSAAPATPPRPPSPPLSPSSPVPAARVLPPPATGWKLNEQGLVSLVAETETPAVLPASCQLAVEPNN
jgi:filamentous hemagglutinin family protein